MDWLDLLAVQGTLNSLLQHHRPIRDANLTFYWRFGVAAPTLVRLEEEIEEELRLERPDAGKD